MLRGSFCSLGFNKVEKHIGVVVLVPLFRPGASIMGTAAWFLSFYSGQGILYEHGSLVLVPFIGPGHPL